MRIKENQCLKCNYKMDAADDLDKQKKEPESGDVSICINCAHVMIFDDNLNFRELEASEEEEVYNHPHVVEVCAAIKSYWRMH